MTDPVTVAVDANGADLGAAEVAAGAATAAERGTRVLLFGSAAEIGSVPSGVEVVDAPVSIAKAADAALAARSTPDASIVRAVKAVAAGEADALVSGGSTGAAIAAGVFNIKRAPGIYRPALALPMPLPGPPGPATAAACLNTRRPPGIYRPALALPMPIPGAPILLLDVGANLSARPEHLVQFAFMGAAMSRAVLGLERPRVALLSNGEEATKGTEE